MWKESWIVAWPDRTQAGYKIVSVIRENPVSKTQWVHYDKHRLVRSFSNLI